MRSLLAITLAAQGLLLSAASALAAHLTFEDTFSQAPAGLHALPDWEFVRGQWSIADGHMQVQGPDALAFCTATPDSSRQRIEADVAIAQRLRADGWALAGLTLYYDRANFWHFALVAGPNAEQRYVELVESLHGRWQAQNDPPLTVSAEENKYLHWEYGMTYRLRLELTSDRISGSVFDAETGRQLSRLAFAFDDQAAVRLGRGGLTARDVSASFDDFRLIAELPEPGAVADLDVEEGDMGRAAVLDEALPGVDPDAAAQTAAILRGADLGVTMLNGQQLATEGLLAASRFDLLALPDCAAFPAEAIEPLMRYLRTGGKLLCLGGPPFSRLCWRVDGQWYDRQGLTARLNQTPPAHLRADFEGPQVGTWPVASNNREGSTAVVRDTADPAQGDASLRFEVEELTGWTTFAAQHLAGPFPEDHALTCFYARGGPRTKFLVLEWREQDRSRWLATVALTTQWQHYALPPEAFEYWRDSPSRGRGGAGDRFNPQNAAELIVGLAQSHAPLPDGRHIFWIDEIGTAPNPLAGLRTDQQVELEILSPFYKTYPITGIRRLRPRVGQIWPGNSRRTPILLDADASAVAPIRRQQGRGLHRGLGYRWIPWLLAEGRDDQRLGTPVSVLVNHAGALRGSAWALVGVTDPPAWQADSPLRETIQTLAKGLVTGVFLAEAGAEHFHYEPGETIRFGARVCNFGRRPAHLRLEALMPPHTPLSLGRQAKADLAPGEVRLVEFQWRDAAPRDGLVTAQIILTGDGLRDVVTHAFEIGTPPADMLGLVTAHDGRFWVGDREWIPYGVNYWPSYAIGAPALQWHGPQYEPAIVEEELATLQSLRMNMVSMNAPSAHWRDLCDFLRRCANHNIRVNLFISGADPMRFDREEVRKQIESAHLADQPALFAYDIAWEPRLGRYNERRRWDREWEQWIVERYGSIENAEKDWAFPVPRTDDGRVTAPSDAQVTNDGDHRRMVAAYRRFADDLISSKYRDATRFIRSLDPNHLIGTRTGYGGTGPCHPAVMAFDLASVAKHLDFASPEGWGMTGDREALMESGITTAYGRLVTAGKPVMWSEFGMQKWDRVKQQPDPELVAREADYYADMYAMMAASGAQGAVPWWWPGGYRVGENSDYGISDPNGCRRPVWRTIAQVALPLSQGKPWPRPEPDVWITIDRDAHVDGYHGIYMAHKAEYGRLLRAGKFPGLRTEGTGTTSADTPLVAVGNVPYNGSNPPKYLNAEFNWVKLKAGEGDWTEITDGAELEAPHGASLQLAASIGNTAEATWLRGGAEGRVLLLSAEGSDLVVRQPISKDTSHLADAEVAPFTLVDSLTRETPVVLEMSAEGRMRFGPKFAFTLRPR